MTSNQKYLSYLSIGDLLVLSAEYTTVLKRATMGTIKKPLLGICCNVEDVGKTGAPCVYQATSELSIGWEHHSGYPSSPIKCSDHDTYILVEDGDMFNCLILWWGKAKTRRMHLLRYIIKQLDEEIACRT